MFTTLSSIATGFFNIILESAKEIFKFLTFVISNPPALLTFVIYGVIYGPELVIVSFVALLVIIFVSNVLQGLARNTNNVVNA